MEHTNISALLLDLDDTLVQSEQRNIELYREFTESFGIEPTKEDQDIVVGSAANDIFRHLIERYTNAFEDGLEDEPTVDRLAERFLAFKRRSLQRIPLNSARGLADILAVPLPKALVSGSRREEIHLILDHLDVAVEAFDLILGNEDYGAGKPDPAGYRVAIRALGIAPASCLVVEDSPQGVEAGRRAGCPVAFVTEFARHRVEADMEFDSIHHLANWLRGLD